MAAKHRCAECLHRPRRIVTATKKGDSLVARIHKPPCGHECHQRQAVAA